MPNHEFVTVARTEAISEGEGISRMVAGRMIALFRHQGEILAVNDICPHMGASLGAGHLDEEGVVTCPWHAWRFSVCDGSWRDNPRLKIETYETRVVGDEVQIRVPMDE
jgi:nitrite reductase (NADH) small subunit/3-phenylpropionate/trans-cinnamate dioxygenase ferredoxin subunit